MLPTQPVRICTKLAQADLRIVASSRPGVTGSTLKRGRNSHSSGHALQRMSEDVGGTASSPRSAANKSLVDDNAVRSAVTEILD